MVRRISLFFLLISLAAFLILPKISLADNFENITPEEAGKYLELPGKDAEKILSTLIQILTTKGINLLTSGQSTNEEIAVVGILRGVVRIDVLNHLLIDAPIEVTGKIIKSATEMARLFGAQDISVVMDKFEKETVKMAVDYGMKVLFQNEIRVTPGAIEFGYNSHQGEKKEVVFQYLIIYQPLNAENAERGKAEIRFYSPTPIEPPECKGSVGVMRGIYHELQQDLPPFITEIQGTVEKKELGNYGWVEGPSIKITFPDSVPDLGIKPLTFWERHLLKPIETAIGNIDVVITKATGKSPNLVNIWNKIKATFFEFKPLLPAAIGETKTPKTEEISTEQIIEQTKREIKQEIKQEMEQAVSEKVGTVSELILDAIQEGLGNFSARLEAIDEKITKLDKEKEIDNTDEIREKSENEEIKDEKEIQPVICQISSGDSPARNKVIINEVAWMGTTNSASDEWIELKNISASQINLTNWQLLDKEKQIKIIFNINNGSPTSIISANGFFLLERTDDDSVPNIAADLIYTGGLGNTNEALYLFDENCQLQDEVIANPDWPAGDNSSKRTMERKSNLDWQTSSEVGGTPKRKNSGGYSEYQGGGYSPPPSTPPPDTESPIANAGPDQTVEINQSIIFDASASTDNVGIISYQWDINNDGQWDLEGVNPTLEEGYSEAGEYLVTLKVADAAGNTATDTLTITVLPPPKILISEIQIAAEGDEKEEFVELYNPNQTDLNLTGWYIQRKTKDASDYSTFAPSTLFSEKIIKTRDYLLIARQDSSFVNLADIITTYPLTENNTLVLKNQNREIIDEVSWEEVPAGTSYGRIWDENAGVYTENFEIQTPTPKAKNRALPEEPSPPELTYLPAIGYSDPGNQWENETLAYDEDINTYARVYVGSVNTSYLELLAPAGEPTQGIRFWVNGGPLCVDIYYDGHWYCIGDWRWEVAPAPGNKWVERTYPSKIVEMARIKFYGTVPSCWGYLSEFQFKTYK